jgi:Tfp pilus assembly protein PilO
MARILPIISIVFLIVLIALGALLWWPQFQKFFDLRKELTAKESQIQEKREYFSRLEEYEDRLENYDEELEKIEYALPSKISLPALFSFFQQLCAVNGLVLEGMSSGKELSPENSSSSQEFEFSATISGSYEKFKDFLDLLYKNSRMIDVASISFKSPSDSRFFKIALNLKTHYLPSGFLGQEESFGR